MKVVLVVLLSLVVVVGGVLGGIVASRSEASTTTEVTIYRPPSYCEFGRWEIGNYTYIGARCNSWEDQLFSDKLKTVIEISQHGGFISLQLITPPPTPTPTYRCCPIFCWRCLFLNASQ